MSGNRHCSLHSSIGCLTQTLHAVFYSKPNLAFVLSKKDWASEPLSLNHVPSFTLECITRGQATRRCATVLFSHPPPWSPGQSLGSCCCSMARAHEGAQPEVYLWSLLTAQRGLLCTAAARGCRMRKDPRPINDGNWPLQPGSTITSRLT